MSDRSYQIETMPPLAKTDKTAVRLAEKSKVSFDVRISDEHGGNDTLSLPSCVEKVHRDSSFIIKMPMHQDNRYLLPQDDIFMMYFTAELEGRRQEAKAAVIQVHRGKTIRKTTLSELAGITL